ncbi:hypothetical protein [Paraburkholderia edwinii]
MEGLSYEEAAAVSTSASTVRSSRMYRCA